MIDFILRPVRKISLKKKRRHCRWGAAEVRPLIGRELYRAIPSTTLDLGFYALNQDKSPLTTSQRHWGTILTGIPTGYLSFIQYKYTRFFTCMTRLMFILPLIWRTRLGWGLCRVKKEFWLSWPNLYPPWDPWVEGRLRKVSREAMYPSSTGPGRANRSPLAGRNTSDWLILKNKTMNF